MILFTILLIILALLLVIGISLLSIGGTAFIVVFGDIIVCAFLVAWIIKILFFRKKKK